MIEKRFRDNPVSDAPEYLQQVALHYWAESDLLVGLMARSMNVHMLRLPSVGFFSSPLTVTNLFGTPGFGVYQDRVMDVKQSLLGAAGEEPARLIDFVKKAGMVSSYLEGSVFDELEGRARPAIKGISAMHLLAAAANQGIPIYRLTSVNSATVLPLLRVSEAVRDDISTAVSQGQTVLAPESNVQIGPWSGVGYIIQDEGTGAGAYLISGGLNGGGMPDCEKKLSPKTVLVLEVLAILLAIVVIIIFHIPLIPPIPIPALAAAETAQMFTMFLLSLKATGSVAAGY